MAFSQFCLFLIVLAVGIASSSACDTGELVNCAKYQTKLATAAKDGQDALCGVMNELKKCMTDVGCGDTFSTIKQTMDPHGSLCPDYKDNGSYHVQPSIIAILATALIMALRSYF